MKTKRLLKWSIFVLAVLLLSCAFFGCQSEKEENIYILYTNDVHCHYLDGVGYDGLSAYKKELEKKAEYVTLVDLGDAIQGDYTSTVTKGQFPTDVMEKVGYDITVIGNHEFDFGVEQLSHLVSSSSVKYLSCNIDYTGNQKDYLKDKVLPYEIKEYGNTRVAYIGVTTPYTVTSSTPAYFMEDGEMVYDFHAGNEGKDLQDTVQGYVDEVKERGADYVFLVTHLGDTKENGNEWFSSVTLAKNTHGVDCVLDGHAHNLIPARTVKNEEGKDVLISSSGAMLEGIGQVVITKEGVITPTVVTGYTEKDEKITAFIKDGMKSTEAKLAEKIGHSDVYLPVSTESGVRLVRNRECAIGDFCADAARAIGGSDIAIFNGGSIRASIPAGDLTYGDIVKLQPFSDSLCVLEITGKELLDVLEFSVRDVEKMAEKDGNAVGENGGFLQVSGMKFTVDTAIKSPIIADVSGMYVSVGEGERRVSQVMILGKDGEYLPLDPEKTYTMACNSYTAKKQGDGYTMLADNKFVVEHGFGDVQVIITYIQKNLQGNIKETDIPSLGRITVK